MAGAPVGNQNARKAKRWESAITRALAKAAAGAGVEAGLDSLADQLVSAATKGEQWALIEIGNRLDGKPAQVVVGDMDDDPIQHSHKVEWIGAPAAPSKT
jgi:hypothetical protein